MDETLFLSKDEYNDYNALSKQIIGAAIEVHRNLGAGLLESAYEYCMKTELESQGLKVETQVELTGK